VEGRGPYVYTPYTKEGGNEEERNVDIQRRRPRVRGIGVGMWMGMHTPPLGERDKVAAYELDQPLGFAEREDGDGDGVEFGMGEEKDLEVGICDYGCWWWWRCCQWWCGGHVRCVRGLD